MKEIVVELKMGDRAVIHETLKMPDSYDFWEIDDYISDWLNDYIEVKWKES